MVSDSIKKLNIIIVGAGPSGLVLSLLLAKYGINVHLVDKSDQLDESPRAAHYQPPAVRYLHLAGVKDEAREMGFLPTGMAWRKFDGTLISGLDLTLNSDDPNQMICLPLDQLGPLLYKHVLQEPLAKVSWSHEVIGTGQDQNEAWIDVKTPEGNNTLRADYIVGCDGATSAIRRCLFGPDFPGKTWEVQIVATNVYYDLHKFGYWDANTIIDKDHFNMCARITKDGLWRVSYGEKTGYTNEELIARQPMKYEALLPGHPKPGEYKLTNINPYKMHQRLADSMHSGRFLLAADAAHLCTPFGGLGLSGGIVDVGNLADCLLAIQLLPSVSQHSTSGPNANSASNIPPPTPNDILSAYSDIRRQKWLDVTNPISSDNLTRLIENDPEKALEQDEFLATCKRAESDRGLMKEMLQGAYALDYDFEGRWGRDAGLGEGWIDRAMGKERERRAREEGQGKAVQGRAAL